MLKIVFYVFNISVRKPFLFHFSLVERLALFRFFQAESAFCFIFQAESLRLCHFISLPETLFFLSFFFRQQISSIDLFFRETMSFSLISSSVRKFTFLLFAFLARKWVFLQSCFRTEVSLLSFLVQWRHKLTKAGGNTR